MLSGLHRKNRARIGKPSTAVTGFSETASEGRTSTRASMTPKPQRIKQPWANFSNLCGTLLLEMSPLLLWSSHRKSRPRKAPILATLVLLLCCFAECDICDLIVADVLLKDRISVSIKLTQENDLAIWVLARMNHDRENAARDQAELSLGRLSATPSLTGLWKGSPSY